MQRKVEFAFAPMVFGGWIAVCKAGVSFEKKASTQGPVLEARGGSSAGLSGPPLSLQAFRADWAREGRRLRRPEHSPCACGHMLARPSRWCTLGEWRRLMWFFTVHVESWMEQRRSEQWGGGSPACEADLSGSGRSGVVGLLDPVQYTCRQLIEAEAEVAAASLTEQMPGRRLALGCRLCYYKSLHVTQFCMEFMTTERDDMQGWLCEVREAELWHSSGG